MKKTTWLAGALAVSSLFGLTACAGNNDTGLRQQMRQEMREEINQERYEDMIDEREDRQLNAPGVEYRQEQREDRIDEIEDNR